MAANVEMINRFQAANPDINIVYQYFPYEVLISKLQAGYNSGTVADMLKPEYKGMIALNGNPKSAAAGLHGVVMAALANGGSADDISAGVKFFNDLNAAGNLLPVDPTPATIAAGQTPCVIDWEYNNAGLTADLKTKGIDWQVSVPSDAPPVASYYLQTINKEAPHPAAAPSPSRWSGRLAPSRPTPCSTMIGRSTSARAPTPAS